MCVNTTLTTVNTLSLHYNTLLISGTASLTLFILCCVYLCICTSKRTREIGQMEWNDFVKYASVLLKIGMVLYSVTLCMRHISSITTYQIWTVQHSIEILAWISLLCGVFGSLLFVFELLLARKLYSKIPVLRTKLQKTNKNSENMVTSSTFLSQNATIHEIRIRKVDIDIFAIYHKSQSLL